MIHGITSGGDSRIRRKSRRRRAPEFEASPDEQWHYKGTRHPPFVLEVGYSQDGDDRDHKVTGLFEQLPGRICTVLRIDITYIERQERSRSSHSAFVSLWTSHDEDNGGLRVRSVLHNQIFRTDHGQAQPGDLVLPFELFVPSGLRGQLPDDLGPEADVRVTFAALSDLVSEAEQRQRDCEGTISPSPAPERYKRVIFERPDGTVAKVTEVPAKRRRVEHNEDSVSRGLGRTRSQTRSASHPEGLNEYSGCKQQADACAVQSPKRKYAAFVRRIDLIAPAVRTVR